MANFVGETNKISTPGTLPFKYLPASYKIKHEVERLNGFVSPCKTGCNSCFWQAKLFQTLHAERFWGLFFFYRTTCISYKWFLSCLRVKDWACGAANNEIGNIDLLSYIDFLFVLQKVKLITLFFVSYQSKTVQHRILF